MKKKYGFIERVQWDILHNLCKNNFNSEKVVKGRSLARICFFKEIHFPALLTL